MSRFHNLNKQQPQHVLDLDLPPNMACVLREKGVIDIKEIPLPILQPDGVLVKIIATGELQSPRQGKLTEQGFAGVTLTISSLEEWVAGHQPRI